MHLLTTVKAKNCCETRETIRKNDSKKETEVELPSVSSVSYGMRPIEDSDISSKDTESGSGNDFFEKMKTIK